MTDTTPTTGDDEDSLGDLIDDGPGIGLSLEERLRGKVRVLSSLVWEQAVEDEDLERWLENFRGEVCDAETERLLALHLLTHFTYFGVREIRVLLRSLYRDHLRYPIVQSIRSEFNGTTDHTLIAERLDEELLATRFLGVGNPSESGPHLLYYFRQENGLPSQLFVQEHELLSDDRRSLAFPNVRRLVFLDDLLASGTQATRFGRRVLTDVVAAAKDAGQTLEIIYLVLFAKADGVDSVLNAKCGFDDIRPLHVINDSELAFADQSRCFVSAPSGIDRDQTQAVASHYGAQLFPQHPLGFGDGQLLLGFHHNIPNNSLPVFWTDEIDSAWSAVFPRYEKRRTL